MGVNRTGEGRHGSRKELLWAARNEGEEQTSGGSRRRERCPGGRSLRDREREGGKETATNIKRSGVEVKEGGDRG